MASDSIIEVRIGAPDNVLEVEVGTVEVDVPRSVGYFGGLAVAVAVHRLDDRLCFGDVGENLEQFGWVGIGQRMRRLISCSTA